MARAGSNGTHESLWAEVGAGCRSPSSVSGLAGPIAAADDYDGLTRPQTVYGRRTGRQDM